ncbi:hypothetical protein GOV12_04450 [Candidatus Pacearchaeota archaeon]|nr:hypothetical protein [Candidatus Pacearchaeota archaeon]
MKNCIICGKELETNETDVCTTCFTVLISKYPTYNDLKEVIEWHKKNLGDLD